MAEGARLESVYRLIPYRGFESPSLRILLCELGGAKIRMTAASLLCELGGAKIRMTAASLLCELGGAKIRMTAASLLCELCKQRFT